MVGSSLLQATQNSIGPKLVHNSIRNYATGKCSLIPQNSPFIQNDLMDEYKKVSQAFTKHKFHILTDENANSFIKETITLFQEVNWELPQKILDVSKIDFCKSTLSLGIANETHKPFNQEFYINDVLIPNYNIPAGLDSSNKPRFLSFANLLNIVVLNKAL